MKTSDSSASKTSDGSNHGDALAEWDELMTLHNHEPILDIGDTDVHYCEVVSQNVDATSSARLDMEKLLHAAEQLERNVPLVDSHLRGNNTSPIHEFSVDEINLLDRQMQQRNKSNICATYFHSDPQLQGPVMDPFHHGALHCQNWSSPTLPLPLYQSHNQGEMLSNAQNPQQLMMEFYGGISAELQWKRDQHFSSIESPPNYAISSQLLSSYRSDSAFVKQALVDAQNAHLMPEVKSSLSPKRQSKRKSSTTFTKRKSHRKEVSNQETTNNREDLLPYVQTLLGERMNDGTDNILPERPLLPLSPYNYYYRDERDNIINGMQTDNDPLPAPVRDFSDAKLRQLLFQHWFDDPCKPKRSHRKSHGKMNFERHAGCR
jgi:hypothetical protein